MCITDRGAKESRSEPIGDPIIGRREKDDLHSKIEEISITLKEHIESEAIDRAEFFKLIRENTNEIKNLRSTTKEVVDAYNIMKATSKGMSFIKEGVVWLAGLAVIGVVINWMIHLSD